MRRAFIEATYGHVESCSGGFLAVQSPSLDDVCAAARHSKLADAHAGGERRQESVPVYDGPGGPYVAVRARLVGGMDVLAEAVKWPDIGDERLTQHAALKWQSGFGRSVRWWRIACSAWWALCLRRNGFAGCASHLCGAVRTRAVAGMNSRTGRDDYGRLLHPSNSIFRAAGVRVDLGWARPSDAR
jgi:hypothetical protein